MGLWWWWADPIAALIMVQSGEGGFDGLKKDIVANKPVKAGSQIIMAVLSDSGASRYFAPASKPRDPVRKPNASPTDHHIE